MSEFDTLIPNITQKSQDREELIRFLSMGVMRMRQICKLANDVVSAHPTLMSEIITDASTAQEAKLRAFWNLMQTFSNQDPQTEPLPDLPAS